MISLIEMFDKIYFLLFLFLHISSIWFDFTVQFKVEESVDQSFGYYSGDDGSVDFQVILISDCVSFTFWNDPIYV